MQRFFPRLLRVITAFSLLCSGLPSPSAIASESASVDQQLRQSFPILSSQLNATAQFRSAMRRVDGRTVSGVQTHIDQNLNVPTGLNPKERQAWMAMAERQTNSLQTFFPSHFGDAFVVEGGKTKVTLQALQANTSAPLEIQAGKVVYRNAYRDTDSLHVAKAQSSEEFLYLKHNTAPKQFDYAVHVEKGVKVKLDGGQVVFVRDGKIALRIDSPYLVDGRGEKLSKPVHWELVGAQVEGSQHIRLVLDAQGLSYPLVIDPAWSGTGLLAISREYHTATRLSNGKVLVTGGFNNGTTLNSAELYDPATGSWSNTGSLITARYGHTATLLPNGKVLVAGGLLGTTLSSAELYDPATGTWSATGSLATARYFSTATSLLNGKVLVAGGFNIGSGILGSAELYDPSTGTWSTTGSLATARYLYTATLLANGKVLAVGGLSGSVQNSTAQSSTELYDPGTGTWSTTGSLTAARYSHAATILANGRVLAVGGFANGSYLASAELYNSQTGTWSATGSLANARQFHTATLLANGNVLVAGGQGILSDLTSAELYDSTTGTWSTTASMSSARELHTATLLTNGKVLAAAGYDGNYLNSSELFDLAGIAYKFYSVAPCRIVDTRNTSTPTLTVNATASYVVNSVGPTGSYSAQGGSASGCNLPTDAKAVFFNFVAVNATGAGFFQAWPFGSPIPTASVLNYANVQSLNLANGIVLPVCDPATATCTKDLNVQANQSAIQLVIDVVGYFK